MKILLETVKILLGNIISATKYDPTMNDNPPRLVAAGFVHTELQATLYDIYM